MKVTVGECSMIVAGMDINCPLCGVVVKSGEHHHCKVERTPKPKRRRKVSAKEVGVIIYLTYQY